MVEVVAAEWIEVRLNCLYSYLRIDHWLKVAYNLVVEQALLHRHWSAQRVVAYHDRHSCYNPVRVLLGVEEDNKHYLLVAY